MTPRFDLADLRLFILAAEEKSLTRAARAMHLSLAAASLRIKALEARLDLRLLYREPTGVTLTPAGLTLLRHARRMMRQAALLQSAVDRHRQEITGHVRIYANTTAVSEFMPAVLRDFLRSHPAISVTLEEKLNPDIAQGVRDGAADLGVLAGPVAVRGLQRIPFSTDRLVVAVAQEHALAARSAVRFAAALGYPQVGLHTGSTLLHFLEQKAAEAGLAPQWRVQGGGFEGLFRMVEAGVGIGILPASA
ncbi:LysR substrate-binding domain-containing protein, partial [Bordetella pseudohinzii]|uniref:LysR substrate-binding domain-containing protein n=1 Tax=Bordetella pseudohinzii TaxID=1331258 RepID=UPI001919C6D7